MGSMENNSDDIMNVCRLCLGDGYLIYVFDDRQKIPENLINIIQVTTGVTIKLSDNVSQKLCNKCLNITVNMFKFRTSSIINDMELKSKAARKLKPVLNKSVEMLLKKYPNIILPSSIASTNISPIVKINENGIFNEKHNRVSKNDKKMREPLKLVKKPAVELPNVIDLEKRITSYVIENKEITLRPQLSQSTEVVPQNMVPTLSADVPKLASELDELQKLPQKDISSSNIDEIISKSIKPANIQDNKTKRKVSVVPNSKKPKRFKSDTDSVNRETSIKSLKYVTKSHLICDICNDYLYNAEELRKHKINHMKCHLCKISFRLLEEKNKHIESGCTMKKVMGDMSTIILKEYEQSEKFRKQYPPLIGDFNKTIEVEVCSPSLVEPKTNHPGDFTINYDEVETVEMEQTASSLNVKLEQYTTLVGGSNKIIEDVEVCSPSLVKPQTNHPEDFIINYDGVETVEMEQTASSLNVKLEQYPSLVGDSNKIIEELEVCSPSLVESKTSHPKELEGQQAAECSLISEQSPKNRYVKQISCNTEVSESRFASPINDMGNLSKDMSTRSIINNTAEKTPESQITSRSSVKPDVNINDENILDVNLDDTENNLLKNLIKKTRKPLKETCAQTDIPCNADIIPCLNKENLFELKNLRKFLNFYKIPVNLCFSHQYSVKFSFESSPTLKKDSSWNKVLPKITTTTDTLTINAILKTNTLNNTTPYKIINNIPQGLLSSCSVRKPTMSINPIFDLQSKENQHPDIGNIRRESNFGVVATPLIPSISHNTASNFSQSNNTFSIVRSPLHSTCYVMNRNSCSQTEVQSRSHHNLRIRQMNVNYNQLDHSIRSQIPTTSVSHQKHCGQTNYFPSYDTVSNPENRSGANFPAMIRVKDVSEL